MDPATLSFPFPPTVRRRLGWLAWLATWAACLFLAGDRIHHARVEFSPRDNVPERERRTDGNDGHTSIDFGGQFVMGRMVVTGRSRDLYHRQAQWPLVWESFPVADESPQIREEAFPVHLRPPGDQSKPFRHDAEALMESMMGRDAAGWPAAASAVTLPLAATHPLAAAVFAQTTAAILTPDLVAAVNLPVVGGPLYPPTHAFLYAPLTVTNDPRSAYELFQWLTLALTFTAGLAIRRISRDRLWLPVTTLAVLLFPGYRSGIDLAQNQMLTLNLLLWGWVLVCRGRDDWAGFAWGLLAFKPIWAVTFLAVPLVMGRWRMLTAMCGTGGAAILLTLPVVGLQPWLDWLAVGREATETYKISENWITLSRDLSGVVRRLTHDFTQPTESRDERVIGAICSAVLVVVAATTAAVYRLRLTRGHVTGTAVGFLMLGAYLCCFHFMYYDAVIAVMPLAVLAANPGWLGGRTYELRDGDRVAAVCAVNGVVLTALAALLIVENLLMRLALGGRVTLGVLGEEPARIAAMPPDAPSLIADTTVYFANDTIILLALWACLAVKLLTRGDAGEPALRRATE